MFGAQLSKDKIVKCININLLKYKLNKTHEGISESEDSSPRACASQLLKAFPRRLRQPSLASRSTASLVQYEVSGPADGQDPLRWTSTRRDLPRRSEPKPPSEDSLLVDGQSAETELRGSTPRTVVRRNSGDTPGPSAMLRCPPWQATVDSMTPPQVTAAPYCAPCAARSSPTRLQPADRKCLSSATAPRHLCFLKTCIPLQPLEHTSLGLEQQVTEDRTDRRFTTGKPQCQSKQPCKTMPSYLRHLIKLAMYLHMVMRYASSGRSLTRVTRLRPSNWKQPVPTRQESPQSCILICIFTSDGNGTGTSCHTRVSAGLG